MTVQIVHAAGYTFPAATVGLVLDLRLSPTSWEAPRTHRTQLSVVPPPDRVAERRDAWGNTVHRVRFGRPVKRVSIAMHLTVSGDGCDLPGDAALGEDVEAAERGMETASRQARTPEEVDALVERERAALMVGWRLEAHPAGETASLRTLLRDRRGRCLELARVLVWRLRSLAIPARFVLGYAIEPAPSRTARQRHAWVAFHDGRRWREVDPSAPDRSAGGRLATAWGPAFAPLMPVRARHPAGLSDVVGTWSTQVSLT